MCAAKTDIDQLCVNTIRMLSIDAVEKAKSGHPGLPLGAAPMAYVIWSKFLRHNPSNPNWFDRDRFILSAGHGSALIYSLLHLTGYDLSLDDLKHFRQWESKTPGHPEYGVTPGVEVTTGPLGQGFAMGVGMAIAERVMAKSFNKNGFPIIGHYIYAIVSDGDLMEGISSEAASMAGKLKLGKLIYLYDDNRISIEGATSLTFNEDIRKRFESCGWHVQTVDDGNNLLDIENAVSTAKEKNDQPSLVIVRTHIGYGSPKQDSEKSHGEPLGTKAIEATKEFFGWPKGHAFYVPEEILPHIKQAAIDKGKLLETGWNELFEKYSQSFPSEASILKSQMKQELPKDWDADIRNLVFSSDEPAMATRDASGKVMNILAKRVPNLIGGSADLGPSTKTMLSGYGDLDLSDAAETAGRNIHFGVREHAMGAVCNGMALHGGIIPYGSTFLVFSDYMRSSIRMACIMGIHSIFVFSHDSIGVGEDGPTHQPIEHFIALRAIPDITVIRPADANETIAAWELAIGMKKPVVLILTRQKLPVLNPDKINIKDGVKKGAYIVEDCSEKPDVILIATGSEVSLALASSKKLAEIGVKARVVSMPSVEIFSKQPQSYKDSVLPQGIKARISIEAGSSMGWHKWVGSDGDVVSIDHFGASAPAEVLFEKFGFTVDNVVSKALNLIKK